MRQKKNLRRISELVTAQTAGNLDKLAAMCGHRDRGRGQRGRAGGDFAALPPADAQGDRRRDLGALQQDPS